jgi:hypothetical protein
MTRFPLLWAPFFAQALAMALDELHFHRKRGLPRWEIWGHPLDTFAAFCCILFLVRAVPDSRNFGIYVTLAVISALLATKDEFVHLERCSPGEQWLHSILFMLHPTVFFCSGFLWWNHEDSFLLQLQAVSIFVFFLYQIIYWGKPWKYLRSTTVSTTTTETAGTPPMTTP